MFPKFSIDYVPLRQHITRAFTHQTDDPVEAEEFLMHLLMTGAKIQEIRHQGEALKGVKFDHMLKIAADRCAADMLRHSLDLDYLSVKDRFGYAA